MNYSILTIVGDQDSALQLSSYMKSNGINAYASQAIEYGYNHWGVYVEEQKLAVAQNLLDSYNQSAVPGYGSNMNYGAKSAVVPPLPAYPSQLSSSKPKKRSSLNWILPVLGGLLIVGVSVGFMIYRSEEESKRYVQYRLEQAKRSAQRISDDLQDMPKPPSQPSYSIPESSNKLTLGDFRMMVDGLQKDLPIALGNGLTCKRISMQGSNIYYDYELEEGYVYLDKYITEEQKRDIAQQLCRDYSSLKVDYGDDLFDQMVKLGISINYRYYCYGQKTPYKTASISASYLKQFDK